MHQGESEMQVMLEMGDLVVRSAPSADGMIVSLVNLPAGTDLAPAFKGLPDDGCPAPHWGMVLSGSVTIHYTDGTEETTKAGECFYWPGGHTGVTTEGVKFLEVSPEKEMQVLLKHLTGG